MDRRDRWQEGIAIGVISSILATLIVGVVVAIISHLDSTWTKPIVNGILAALLTLGASIGIMILRVIPKIHRPTNTRNIEGRIREWFDAFHLGVRKTAQPDTYFHFIVTTSGGKEIGVARSKTEWTDYLGFFTRLSPSEPEQAALAQLSDKEKIQLRFDMKMELARSRIGYSDFSLNGFVVFKRIPVGAGLSEDSVINTIWEMEAIINGLILMALKALEDHEGDPPVNLLLDGSTI
jgi:hypothetical protein